MMPRMRAFYIGMAGLALAGCEKADNAPGPGGVTMGEARALDEAAQMLEERQPPPGLSAPSSQGPTEQTEEDAAGPTS